MGKYKKSIVFISVLLGVLYNFHIFFLFKKSSVEWGRMFKRINSDVYKKK